MSEPDRPSPAQFLAGAAPVAADGNSPWASAMAREVRGVVTRASERAPRSQQVHLGPSELGVACDRQVVGKLLREPTTNHVTDPWPSVVGTAVHAWLADAFDADNLSRYGGAGARWLTETRVVPHPDHAGTADLYDAQERAVLDHKCLGDASMSKVRGRSGPPVHYKIQLGLYALGYLRAGYPVDRVGIIAYPRTGSSIHGVYVWERALDAEYMDEIAQCFTDTARRKDYAALVESGALSLDQVPVTPSDDGCYFCPFYRPQSAHDGQAGCPGNRKDKTS